MFKLVVSKLCINPSRQLDITSVCKLVQLDMILLMEAETERVNQLDKFRYVNEVQY